MTTPFLSILGVSKRYEEVTAVDGVSIDVAEGEFLTLLGPSGSGKTTTLFIIAGFQEPTSGQVLLQGRSLLEVLPHKRNIGMVFQRYTLFPHLSVAENVAFPLRVRRKSAAEVSAKVAAVLELVRLEGYGGRLPSQLSGGQQQRVALARALAYDPPLLLMDEPLSALDKKLREEIQGEIRSIHRETGVTILYVTHDQEEALRLSDRVALFNHGQIEQIGTGEELYNAPATRFVAGFIGNSNFIDGEAMEARDGAATVRLPDGTLLAGIAAHPAAPGGRSSTLMVRPERLQVCAAGSSPAPYGNASIPAVVADRVFLGDNVQLQVVTRWGQALSVRTAAGLAATAPGDEVAVCFDPSDAHLFPASEV